MKSRSPGLRVLGRSVIAMCVLSLTSLTLRISGFTILDGSFELLCVHIPALTSLALYISMRIGWLKLGA